MEIVQTSPSFTSSLSSNFLDRNVSAHRILVVDGDPLTHTLVGESISDATASVVSCHTVDEAVSEFLAVRATADAELDLVIWGLSAPFEESLGRLREARELAPQSARFLLLAPQEALAHAAEIKSANVDGLVLKPCRMSDFKSGIERTLRRPKETTGDSVTLRSVSTSASGLDLGLIGESAEMKRVYSLIRKIGPSMVNVLVTGESGTGKEMVARALHTVSARSKKPFVAINCAAIPRELLESELFGHAKGAFTGATAARRGLFEEAHEGTILLDEIGDLPLNLQAKILRLIQTKEVKAIGQNSSREVDVRIISATHKNLKNMIQKGEFREDLYYRLNVMPVHLPALRDRKDDILLLAEFFLRKNAEAGRGPIRLLSRRAGAKLMSLPWKGNVRELENVIERAMVLADGDHITDIDVMAEESEPVRATAEDLFNAGLSLKDIEREYIKYVLNRTSNRKEAAVRILGIDRKTLYRKEKLYGIRTDSEDLN
ncbi:MAG: sigma-54 dependent transcriptional regulator [Bdellovibrionota bacterium]